MIFQRKRFNNWTRTYLGFVVKSRVEGGHVSIRMTEEEGEEEFNLADMGFGFSQMLPLITQLWHRTEFPQRRTYQSRSRAATVFVIEQPELHLHPALQAKIADLFLSIINTSRNREEKIILFIETHSEIIISRIGNRIASSQSEVNPHLTIDPSDVQLILFEQKEAGNTHVKVTCYDDNGFLINWPYGFFQPDLV